MHLSDSTVQMQAEKIILRGLEKFLNIPIGELQSKKMFLNNASNIEIDGYSDQYKIMVEVFARIGKLEATHYEKIANDILKLKLAEDIQNITYKKYFAVCGEEAEKYLLGTSWKAYAADYYNIIVIRIDLPEEARKRITDAQKKQKEGMKL